MDSSATLSDSVLEIPLSEIAVIARQRKKLDPKLVQELADDIAENGLLHPIVVRRPFPEEPDVAGHPYVLCVGGRRFAAHAFLHRATIRATLRDDMDPLQAKIAELSENIKRVDISWQEKVDAEAAIHALRRQQNPAHQLTHTAAELNIDRGNLARDLALHEAMKADPSLRTAKSALSARRVLEQKTEVKKRLEAAAVNRSDEVETVSKLLACADMRKYIRTLPENSVDLCLTDFPYGIDIDKNTVNQADPSLFADDANDTYRLLFDIVPEILRVVKPTGWIACFIGHPLDIDLANLIGSTCRAHYGYQTPGREVCTKRPLGVDSPPCWYVEPEEKPWIWYKPNSHQFGHWPELHAGNAYEIIVVASGGEARLTTPVMNVLAIDQVFTERTHINQKPHELGRELIRRFTVLGETVLDLCFGSGSFMAAAADSGRRFLGCDLNPENLPGAIELVSRYYSKPVAEALRGAQEKAE